MHSVKYSVHNNLKGGRVEDGQQQQHEDGDDNFGGDQNDNHQLSWRMGFELT